MAPKKNAAAPADGKPNKRSKVAPDGEAKESAAALKK